MQTVKDPERLSRYVEELKIGELFDTEGMTFSLQRYEKGEFLSAPHIRQRDLLFLAEGRVRIYGIRADARLIPVGLAERGSLIGDVEFCTGMNSNLFSEALEDVLCVALSVAAYGKDLDHDVKFLHVLLRQLSGKVYMYSTQDSPPVSVEERLLDYLRAQTGRGQLCGVEKTAMRIGCSRRQLQRTLRKLCEEGTLQKYAKGSYRLLR